MSFKNFSVVLVVCFVLIGILSYFSILEGSVPVSSNELKDYVLNGTTGNSGVDKIIKDLRLTRVIGCFLVGAAVSISGLLMQGYFRNPLADPYFMGVSSGAGLGIAIYMFTSVLLHIGISNSILIRIVMAYIGSIITMLLVIGISKKVKQISTLLICGMMISGAVSGLSDVIVTTGNYIDTEGSGISGYLTWGMGSVQSLTWDQLKVMAVVILPFIFLTYILLSKSLDANLIGESYAASVGVDLKKFKRLLILLSCILTSTVVAFTGPISFIGIICPIIARGILNTSKHIYVFPITALLGITFLIFADILARPGVLFTSTVPLPLHAPLSLIGAPISLLLFFKSRNHKI
ncbi:transport system permease protein [Methanococcus vannielii SB]|uniref:Transport system permease protein n=1 Tax=Methanococcus vannielii (strain ATCC 35089 / DSM 1224 / JCM 13029 / OCM 148 / SB) TaxID=406327 RepID=A6UNG9_METVS|nr:iron ABC transporter permease [Methanococcus vannielii]ABR54041.1 transport system permease protein [Methanococcus vannielii SB]